MPRRFKSSGVLIGQRSMIETIIQDLFKVKCGNDPLLRQYFTTRERKGSWERMIDKCNVDTVMPFKAFALSLIWTLSSLLTIVVRRHDSSFPQRRPARNALASSRWGLFASSTAFAYPFNASAYCTFVAYPAVNRLLIASSDSLFPILADIKKCFTAKWQFPALYSTTPRPCLLSASHFTAACCQC